MTVVALPLWNEALIQKYNLNGPRYTSYPTALKFTDRVNLNELHRQVRNRRDLDVPLSLYLHIPFCAHLCYYCGCNKIVTRRREKASRYLTYLHQEIALQAAMFGNKRVVEQLHLGGGTPTYLSEDELHALMTQLRAYFNILETPDVDISIEIDPRECSSHKLKLLRYEGFNRLSLGVQDIDPLVQKAVNRVQPIEMVEELLAEARRLNFRSINMDLIDGLPHQTPDGFAKTLDRIIELSPDRLSLFNYAHLPERFAPQKRIREEDLPSAADKLHIFKQSIQQLAAAGYQYIGMDHFAKPDDSLAIAQRQGQLHRNFQGYTTHSHCDLVAMGVSAISQVGDSIYQNSPDLESYEEAIEQHRSPIVKGVHLNADDLIRNRVIMQLICHFNLTKSDIEQEFNIQFDSYFATELNRLHDMEKDGLVKLSQGRIVVTPAGRVLIRAVCSQFDAYLQPSAQLQYSRII